MVLVCCVHGHGVYIRLDILGIQKLHKVSHALNPLYTNYDDVIILHEI